MDGFVVFKLPAPREWLDLAHRTTHTHKHNTNWTFCLFGNAHMTMCRQEKWRDMGQYSGMHNVLWMDAASNTISKCTRNMYWWVPGLSFKRHYVTISTWFVQESYISGNNGSLWAGRERGAKRKHSLTSMLFGCFCCKCVDCPPGHSSQEKETGPAGGSH